MRRCGITLSLWLLLTPYCFADEVTMNLEIDHILDTVAASNCVFIRNGKEHGPADAKDHLNLKRRRGKKYFSNADEFIENLASSSSWSGKPYHIQCGEEEPQLASAWFDAVLSDYRGAQSD